MRGKGICSGLQSDLCRCYDITTLLCGTGWVSEKQRNEIQQGGARSKDEVAMYVIGCAGMASKLYQPLSFVTGREWLADVSQVHLCSVAFAVLAREHALEPIAHPAGATTVALACALLLVAVTRSALARRRTGLA